MTQDIDTFWTHNAILDEGDVQGNSSLIRLRLHRSQEKYSNGDDFIKLSQRNGERIYFLAKPYILIPDMTVTFASYRYPAPDGAIGEVISSDVKKLKPLEIGMAQAWYYPADNILMLWECFLEASYRQPELPNDTLYRTVWTGFERVLLEQLPETKHIYTTWEPIYPRSVYKRFLKSLGYDQHDKAVFVKAL